MEELKKFIFEMPILKTIKEDIIRLWIAQKFWKEVVGEELAKKTRPYCVNKGVLIVEVDDIFVGQIISLKSYFYIEKLNKRIFSEKIFSDLQAGFKGIKIRIKKKERKRVERIVKKRRGDLDKYMEVCKYLEDKELRQVFEAMLRAYVS